MDNDISANESPIEMLRRIDNSLDAMESRYNRSKPNPVVSDGHVQNIRRRLEEPKEVIMTGTEESRQAAAQQKLLPGVEPGSVERAVSKIEATGTEQQPGHVAARQDSSSGIEPGAVAKAVRTIEEGQTAKGRAQLDERDDHARSGRA